MKKYEILYAQDIPHYGTVELEAESDAEILEAAKAYWSATDVDPVDDPDWKNPVCKRIVVIRDEAGNEISNDIRCDDYSLEYITDEEVGIREAANEMLDMLVSWSEFCDRHAVKDANGGDLPIQFLTKALIAKARGQA